MSYSVVDITNQHYKDFEDDYLKELGLVSSIEEYVKELVKNEKNGLEIEENDFEQAIEEISREFAVRVNEAIQERETNLQEKRYDEESIHIIEKEITELKNLL